MRGDRFLIQGRGIDCEILHGAVKRGRIDEMPVFSHRETEVPVGIAVISDRPRRRLRLVKRAVDVETDRLAVIGADDMRGIAHRHSRVRGDNRSRPHIELEQNMPGLVDQQPIGREYVIVAIDDDIRGIGVPVLRAES